MEDRGPKPNGQRWEPGTYAAHGRFVADLASPLIELLDPQPGERILDVGCGDGVLSAQLKACGAEIVAIDSSEAMVAAARGNGIDSHCFSATCLPYVHEFDAVFSNAALHWIPAEDQPAALIAIHRALKPGGRLAVEMGGQNNIAAIRTALQAVLQDYGIDAEAEAASFFPSVEGYSEKLRSAGFRVASIGLHPRPTSLPNGVLGMETWLTTFRNGVLSSLSPSERDEAIRRTVSLLRGILSDKGGSWTADYVRLRFWATA